MSFKLVLKGFKLKRLVVEPKNGSTGWTRWGTDRPQAQLVEVLVDPQLNWSRPGSTHSSTGRGPGRPTTPPIEARVDPQLNRSMVQKNFLFLPKGWFNRSRLNLNELRSGRGPIEVRLRPNDHLSSIKC